MKGFALIEAGKTAVLEKPDLKIVNPTDALIDVTMVAPCTSDVHLVANPMFDSMLGHFIGHEAVGIVREVGSAVKDFKPGDRVLIPDLSPDWSSLEAQDGHPSFAPGASRVMRDDMEGEFAEQVLFELADGGLAKIPDGVTDEQAVMVVDMIATAAAPFEFLDIKLGETVAVLGIGPVGLMAVELASISGASRIFAVGSRQACKDAAVELGATDVIDYHNGPIAEQILALMGGKKVDKVIVCGGESDVIPQAYAICKNGGRIANVCLFFTVCPENANMPGWGYCDIAFQSFQLLGGRLTLERLLALIEHGRLHPEKIISHRFEGFDAIPEAFEVMSNKTPDLIKPVVKIK